MDPALKEYLDKLSESLTKSFAETRSELKTLLQGQTMKLDELSDLKSGVKELEATHDNVADALAPAEETADIVPVLAASAASAKPLNVDATGATAPTPTTCSTNGSGHDTGLNGSVGVSLILWGTIQSFTASLGASLTQPCRLFVTLELDTNALTRCSTMCFVDDPMVFTYMFVADVAQSVTRQGQVLRPIPWPSFKCHLGAAYTMEPSSATQVQEWVWPVPASSRPPDTFGLLAWLQRIIRQWEQSLCAQRNLKQNSKITAHGWVWPLPALPGPSHVKSACNRVELRPLPWPSFECHRGWTLMVRRVPSFTDTRTQNQWSMCAYWGIFELTHVILHNPHTSSCDSVIQWEFGRRTSMGITTRIQLPVLLTFEYCAPFDAAILGGNKHHPPMVQLMATLLSLEDIQTWPLRVSVNIWPLSSCREFIAGAMTISVAVTCMAKLCSAGGIIFTSSGSFTSFRNGEHLPSLGSTKTTYTLALPTPVESMFSVETECSDPMYDILHSSSLGITTKISRGYIGQPAATAMQLELYAIPLPIGMINHIIIVNWTSWPWCKICVVEMDPMTSAEAWEKCGSQHISTGAPNRLLDYMFERRRTGWEWLLCLNQRTSIGCVGMLDSSPANLCIPPMLVDDSVHRRVIPLYASILAGGDQCKCEWSAQYLFGKWAVESWSSQNRAAWVPSRTCDQKQWFPHATLDQWEIAWPFDSEFSASGSQFGRPFLAPTVRSAGYLDKQSAAWPPFLARTRQPTLFLSWDPGIWTLHCLYEGDCEQASFQGGKSARLRAAFSDHIHLGYGYYLEEAYYYGQVCTDLSHYHEDCHGDPRKIKELHTPGDPGELALRSPSKIRLGGKPSCKERGVLEVAHSHAMMVFFHGRCCCVDHAYYYYDQVRVGHHYYLDTFLEQVPTGYDYYIDDAGFFDLVQVHLNHGYYCNNYQGDFVMIKDLQTLWDPGELFVATAWGQAVFQEGRGVSDLPHC